MIVNRVIQSVIGQQFVAEVRVEVLVAHPALGVLLDGRVLMRSLGQNVAFLVEAIHSVDTLGIHEVRGIPAAGGIEHHIVGAGIRLVLLLRGERWTVRHGQTEAGQPAELQKIASRMHVMAHS
jgi:hypothetical protein